MKLRIAINGFGRIGRSVAKCLAEKYGDSAELVAVNDLTDAKTLAHLMQYDSFFGTYDKKVTADGDNLLIDGVRVPVLSQKDPALLPWKDLAVDVVLECTGFFRTAELARKHIEAGAKKVVLSAPAKDETPTYVLGVNEQEYHGEDIISNASCTTNALAPLAKILHEAYGIESALMSTTHSYTQDQRLQDAPHKDLRRARSAAVSIIPTTTGAAKAVEKVIPALAGKLGGHSFRVPTQDVSLIDFTCLLKNPPSSSEDVLELFRVQAKNMPEILSINTLPLVSVDFKKDSHSAILDAELTMLIGKQLKIVAWYDNEWGYSMRLADMCVLVGQHGKN